MLSLIYEWPLSGRLQTFGWNDSERLDTEATNQ
jgi:hypothetical protein